MYVRYKTSYDEKGKLKSRRSVKQGEELRCLIDLRNTVLTNIDLQMKFKTQTILSQN